ERVGVDRALGDPRNGKHDERRPIAVPKLRDRTECEEGGRRQREAEEQQLLSASSAPTSQSPDEEQQEAERRQYPARLEHARDRRRLMRRRLREKCQLLVQRGFGKRDRVVELPPVRRQIVADRQSGLRIG